MTLEVPSLKPSGWLVATGLVATSLLAFTYLQRWYTREFVEVEWLQLALYCAAAWLLLKGRLHAKGREREALIAIVLVAAALRGIALISPQALSTDVFRYVWDGRVQGAGINPYRYIPADPALLGLRDESVYPNINRADYAHTIYPPMAQLIYFLTGRISDGVLAMKLAMTAFDGLTIACLIGLLQFHRLPTTRVLLYAWHPLPIWEFSGSGHVDAAAIALMMLACLLAARRSPAWAGVALAAAALVKYTPVILGPALYRHWDWRLPAAFAATAVALYLPYLGVGRAVLGFLPAYAGEEGLANGSGFFLWLLLQWLSPAALPNAALSWYAPFAALVMAALALYTLLAPRRNVISMDGGFLLASAFMVIFSPHFAWYFAWLVPFLCFRFSVGHVWLTGACTLIYVLPLPFDLTTHSVIYVPFVLLLAAQWFVQRRRDSIRDNDHVRDTLPSRSAA